jgi:hypothetical protein
MILKENNLQELPRRCSDLPGFTDEEINSEAGKPGEMA